MKPWILFVLAFFVSTVYAADLNYSSTVPDASQRRMVNTYKDLGDGTHAPLVATIPMPSTSGGLTIWRSVDVSSTGVSVKGSTGQVFGWYFFNAADAIRYVKLYNKATAPTVGSDTPVMTIGLPAGGGANVEFSHGIAFSLGIGIAAVTGVADNNTTAPTANDVVGNLLYK